MDMDLEQKAIMRLREAADTSERFYKAPLIVTTSGGKDSSVCVALAEKAGIDFEVMHNHTTVAVLDCRIPVTRSRSSASDSRSAALRALFRSACSAFCLSTQCLQT